MRLKRLMFTSAAIFASLVPMYADSYCSSYGVPPAAYMEGGACFQGPPCPPTCYFWGWLCISWS